MSKQLLQRPAAAVAQHESFSRLLEALERATRFPREAARDAFSISDGTVADVLKHNLAGYGLADDLDRVMADVQAAGGQPLQQRIDEREHELTDLHSQLSGWDAFMSGG